MERFKIISKFTRIQKDRTIRSVNPDWIDLSIGLDFEQIMVAAIQTMNTNVRNLS
jgi:putative endonuclease